MAIAPAVETFFLLEITQLHSMTVILNGLLKLLTFFVGLASSEVHLGPFGLNFHHIRKIKNRLLVFLQLHKSTTSGVEGIDGLR